MWLFIASAAALDLDSYRLAGAPWEAGGSLGLVSPEVGEPGQWSAGVAGVYAHEPAPGLIDGLGTVRIAGAWVPVEHLRLELELAAHAAVITGTGQLGALGDAELRARVPVAHLGHGPVGFALAVQPVLALPLGNASLGVGAGSVGGGLTVPAGLHLGHHVRVDANVSVLATRPAAVGELALGSWFGYGAGVGVDLPADLHVGAELTGRVDLVGAVGPEDAPLDAGVSVAWAQPSGLGVALGGNLGLLEGPGAPAARVVLAIGFVEHAAPAAPTPRTVADTDADGLPDERDLCLAEPEDVDGTRDLDGCPDLDDDGDTVVDAEDLCRGIPGPARFQGCFDGDGDGVGDAQDACPSQPGTADGCPGPAPFTARR